MQGPSQLSREQQQALALAQAKRKRAEAEAQTPAAKAPPASMAPVAKAPPMASNGAGMGSVNPMVEMGQRAQAQARQAGADFSTRAPKIEQNPNARATPAIDREFYTSGADKRGWRPEQYAAVQRAKSGSQDAGDRLALRSWENSDSFVSMPYSLPTANDSGGANFDPRSGVMGAPLAEASMRPGAAPAINLPAGFSFQRGPDQKMVLRDPTGGTWTEDQWPQVIAQGWTPQAQEYYRNQVAARNEANRERSPLENFVGDVAGDLAAPFQQNENLRTIAGAPVNFGHGLGQGVQNMSNNLMAVGTEARNAVLNQFDPGREQSVAPRISLFDQNALVDEGGLLSSDAGVIPRIAGQISAARVPIGNASPFGGAVAMGAKDAAALGLTTEAGTPNLSNMIASDTPVIGGVADMLRSREGDSTAVSMMKNAGEDLLLSGLGYGALKTVDGVGNKLRGRPFSPDAGMMPPNADPATVAQIRRIMARDGAEQPQWTPELEAKWRKLVQDERAALASGDPQQIASARQALQSAWDDMPAGSTDEAYRITFDEPDAVPPTRTAPPPIQPQPAAQAAQPPAPVQTATSPPVPPHPPVGGPPVAAGAAGNPPGVPVAQAAQTPPPGTLTPSGNGVAVDSFNNLPVKTREGVLRALEASGMTRPQAFDAIRSLNDLPPDRANMFEFELVRRFGGPDQFPDLEANLTAMGSDFSMQTGRKGGSPQKVMNNSLLDQAQSEGEYLTRMAEDIFGEGKVATKQQLDSDRAELGGQYRKQLAQTYPGMTRLRSPQAKLDLQAKIDPARKELTEYLLRPEVMDAVPQWVRDQVMLQVSDDLRFIRLDDAGQQFRIQQNPELAPLLTPERTLQYSPKVWKTLVEMYPTQVGHSLQSAYRQAIDEAYSGISNAVDRTTAKKLKRLRGESRVRSNAADPNKRGYGLLHLIEQASPGYKEIRQQFGDVVGAQKAADMPNSFFRDAKDEEALANFIDVYDNELTPLQQEAVRNGVTTQIRQALKNKTEFTRPWELDAIERGHLPNLTAVSSQPFLEALPRVFGRDGERMADAIRLSRANIDNIQAINKNFASGTPKGLEIQKNARNLYESPSATNLNPIDATTSTLSGVGALSAVTGNAPLSAAVLGGAAARALYRAYKNGKSLSFAQKEALADWLFKPRRATDAAPPTTPRRFSKLGYAGNVLTGAGVGAGVAAASGQDPTAGAVAGAIGGGVRAGLRGMRAERSIIKPPPAGPRGGNRLRTGGNPPPAVGPRGTPRIPPNDAGFAGVTPLATMAGGAGGYLGAQDINGDGTVDAGERAAFTIAGAAPGFAYGAGRALTRSKGNALKSGPAKAPPAVAEAAPKAPPAGPAASVSEMPGQMRLASTRLKDGSAQDVVADVFTDRGVVVVSPSWPTNAGDDLADALVGRSNELRGPRKGLKVVGEDYAPNTPREPSPKWSSQNPQEMADLTKQVADRFIGLSAKGDAHVLALTDEVDLNSLASYLEGKIPSSKQLVATRDGGEIAIVSKRFLRDNADQFASPTWEPLYPSYNQGKGLRPAPADWAKSGAPPKAPPSPTVKPFGGAPKPPPVQNGFGGSKLPMDEASRMQRAREQGFDVDTPLYHGTAGNIEAFDPAKFGNATGAQSAKLGVWLTSSPDTAAGYAKFAAEDTPVSKILKLADEAERKGNYDEAALLQRAAEWKERDITNNGGVGANVMPVYVRGRIKTIDMDGAKYDPQDTPLTQMAQQAKAEGYDGLRLQNFSDEAGWGQYSPTGHVLVFNPKNIRGKFAKFDPAQSSSSKLLAGFGNKATYASAGGGIAYGELGPLEDLNNDGVKDEKDRAAMRYKYGMGGIMTPLLVRGGVGMAKSLGNKLKGVKAPPKRPFTGVNESGIKAYHGSPHDFDKFELSDRTIGTGEGAQAYGHGLYFAENESVAANYRKGLSQASGVQQKSVDEAINAVAADLPDSIKKQIGYDIQWHPDDVASKEGGASYAQRIYLRNRFELDKTPDAVAKIRAAVDAATEGKSRAGRLYEVDINAEPDDFLDWDAPLSADHPARTALLEAAKQKAAYQRRSPMTAGRVGPEVSAARRAAKDPELTGATLHNVFNELKLDVRTEAKLREAGIPGIKFLDQGSRGVYNEITRLQRGIDLNNADIADYSKGNPQRFDASDIQRMREENAADEAKIAQLRKSGDGTRNYVVFDDSAVNIINKSGFIGGGKGPKAPPKPRGEGPGIVSRMVSGGVIGGLAGSAGSADPQEASAVNEFLGPLAEERKRIRGLEKELNIILNGTVEEKQAYLAQSRGLKISATGEPDGKLGPDTRAAIAKARTELEAAIREAQAREKDIGGKAEKRRAEIEMKAAFDRTRSNGVTELARELGPWVGIGAGVLAGTLMRRGAVQKTAAQSAAKASSLNRLLSDATPTTSDIMVGRKAMGKRATNLNEFWYQGGAGKPDNLKQRFGGAPKKGVPFMLDENGDWMGRPSAKDAFDLFKPGTKHFKMMDVAVIGAAMAESEFAGNLAKGFHQEAVEAQAAVDKAQEEGNAANLEIAMARLESAKNAEAAAIAFQRFGQVAALARTAGAFKMPYEYTRPNVKKAQADQALILDAINRSRNIP